MARDNKVRMPSSSAGITQYWDDSISKIQLKPQHVIIILVIVILLEISIQSGVF